MNNLIKRIITGVFLVFLIFSIVWYNRLIFLLGLILISNISIFEMNGALSKMNYPGLKLYSMVFNTIFLYASYTLSEFSILPLFTTYIVFLFILLVLDENVSFNEVLSNTFMSVYITIPYAHLLLLEKKEWAIYVFAIAAVTDTCAFVFGKLFGRYKLFEKLSPKKTIEGFVGGVIGGVIFTYFYLEIFNFEKNPLIFLACIAVTVVSQIGDLFASYIKRVAGIKDYGNILMGHGGIMDRFDSLLLIAPIIYVLISILR